MYLELMLFILVETVNSKFEPLVLDGVATKIKFYPHSTYLDLACMSEFVCGGSILNQLVVLTAGHCLEVCSKKTIKKSVVKYGHESIDKMASTPAKDFIVHEGYDGDELKADIALVVVKDPITLGHLARRVALLRSPPRNIKLAYMAGWGAMNVYKDPSDILMQAVQKLQSPKVCRDYFGRLPLGTFCAGPIDGPGLPDLGDSGSALIVQSYIQVGLVSYKLDQVGLVVYTNVSHYYHWIKKKTDLLVCRTRQYN